MPGFLIVGGSYAALQMALSARQAGYQGEIAMVHEEEGLPYQKPCLSKEFLTDGMEADACSLRPASFFEQHGIRRQDGARAVRIDREARQVELQSGEAIAYDWLGLALGSRARTIDVPGAGARGILTLRTLADAQTLRSELAAATRVVIVGGGFIGLEVAAAAAALGKPVSVLEAQGRLLQRALGDASSRFLQSLHSHSGVDILLGRSVLAFESRGGRVCAVLCANGESFAADLVVVGVGAVANDELAQQAGVATADGVLVDACGVSSDPRVVAAGDCTRFRSNFSEHAIRLESVQNATDQARAAGAWVAGRAAPYSEVPWFWTVQHGCRVQIAGLFHGADEVVFRGRPDSRSFTCIYLKNGVPIAADSINQPAEHMAMRKLIARGEALVSG